MKKRQGRLFSKAILVLSAVSIVPVVLIGWHVLRMDSRVLQNEILDKQRTVATRIAAILTDEVSRTVQLFSLFIDLHTDFGGHNFINQQDLEYLREKNSQITHISLLNPSGRQLLYSRSEDSHFNYAPQLSAILHACVMRGERYIGALSRSEGQLYALLAFPLRMNRKDKKVSGVLVAEMNLSALGHALEESYPNNMFVSVVNFDGNLISYSGAQGGLALSTEGPLQQEIRYISQALHERTSALVKSKDGGAVLVSRAFVPELNWNVYVQQPADMIRQLVIESTFNSFWDITAILLVMTAFVLLISRMVIIPIVRPVQRLQKAAVKLEQEDDYMPTEKDLIIPDNEIGQLARIFLQMAVVLRERKNALLAAQKKLVDMNKELELRVQQRTAELKAATDELVKSERLAAIGQMASIISHEIRNPLAVISNAARLIKVIEPPKEPKLIKQFSIIEAEIRQANSIISEVLGFARSRELILSALDLNSYLRELIFSFPTTAHMHIREKLDKNSARLKIDAEEMKQALRNLISNACDSMQGQGVVTVGTKVGKRVACIYVADEGPGISEELKAKIFSPFFTTKARGTGLGLAVVRKAVSRHKGKIFIKSEEGKGTIFAIYLKIYTKPGDTRYG